MRITDRLVPATELNRNSKDVLARATAGARLVVVNNNQPIAAIVPLADLNRLEDLDEKHSLHEGQQPLNSPPPLPPTRLIDLKASPGHTAVGTTPVGHSLELQVAAHTLVVGTTGSGKSITLSAMLAGFHQSTAIPTVFIVGTSKPTAPQIKHARDVPWPLPVAAVYTDLDNSDVYRQKFLKVVRQSMALRHSQIQDSGVKTISELRTAHPDEHHSDVIIVIDEPGNPIHRDIQSLIGTLLDRGADHGFYLWLFTQSEPGDEHLFTQRIAHRTNTAAASRAVIGSNQARSLQTGEGLLAVTRTDTPTLDLEIFRVAPPDREPYWLTGVEQTVVDRNGTVFG